MGRHKRSELSTRDQLIEAAISIIESEGEVTLRVDRVAEAAGFTKPVLYHHFTDREGIIAAAQAERFRRSLETGVAAAAEQVERATTPAEFLAIMRQLLKMYASAEGEKRRGFRIEVLGSAVSRPSLRESIIEAGREHIDQFVIPLTLAASRGWLRPGVDARDLAQWWVGLVLSRHLFEIDKDGFRVESWDAVTDAVLCSMIVGL